jgi:hypothetical protein
LALAVLAAWALFGASAQAEYISPAAGVGNEANLGASGAAPEDATPSDREGDSLAHLTLLLLLSPDRAPSNQAGAGSAGATGSTGPGGSSPPVGVSVRPPLLSLQPAGRIMFPEVTRHPQPFHTGIFHPPRAA